MKALSQYLIRQAESSNMPQELIQGLRLNRNGEMRVPTEASSYRTWIESRIVSLVNKVVVNTNTPGGSAI
jgi:hypothetical protein